MGALARVSILFLCKSISLTVLQVLTLFLFIIGNLASLVVPAAAAGAVGYGYMWWKVRTYSILHSFSCLGISAFKGYSLLFILFSAGSMSSIVT